MRYYQSYIGLLLFLLVLTACAQQTSQQQPMQVQPTSIEPLNNSGSQHSVQPVSAATENKTASEENIASTENLDIALQELDAVE